MDKSRTDIIRKVHIEIEAHSLQYDRIGELSFTDI